MQSIIRYPHAVPPKVFWEKVFFDAAYQQRLHVEVLGATDFEILEQTGSVESGVKRRVRMAFAADTPAAIRKLVGDSFASDGSPIGVAGQINTYTTDDQKLPSIAGDGAGAFVVVWTSKGSVGDDTATYSIQAQRIRLDLFSDGFELGTLAAWSDARPAV